MKILYICDRKKCANCHDECKHTTDLGHAANFKRFNGICEEQETTPEDHLKAVVKWVNSKKGNRLAIEQDKHGVITRAELLREGESIWK